MRLPVGDPRRQVTLLDDGVAPKLPEVKRVGRPRTHWATITMERIWDKMKLHERLEPQNQQFDVHNPKHLDHIEFAAEMHEF